jgi:hypothetical protein
MLLLLEFSVVSGITGERVCSAKYLDVGLRMIILLRGVEEMVLRLLWMPRTE